MEDAAIANVTLFPTADLIDAATSMSNLSEIQTVFNKHQQSDLYQEGLLHPFTLIPEVEENLRYKNKPLTIIVFPGMFAEFIPELPYADLNDNSSFFAQKWYTEFSQTTLPKEDDTFDLFALANISLPLTDFFVCTSYDDDQGVPLFQMVEIKLHSGSLESLGDMESTTYIYLRRIEKFLNIMKAYIDHIYLAGNSRTGADVVQIVTQARENGLWWGNDVRGIITIAGVNFGTPVADCAIGDVNSDPPSLCDSFDIELSEIKSLSDELVPDISHVVQNGILWAEALGILLESELNKPTIPEMNDLELIWPSLYKTWQELLKDVLFDEFDLRHPVEDYAGNVVRFQTAVTAIYDCVWMLTTAARASWWATHTVPTDITYMTVTGTQPDAAVNVGPKVHTDTYMMRESFYQMIMMGGGALNDAQVSHPRGLFLPAVHQRLNTAQKPYTSHWLGSVQATHWGVAIGAVFPSPDGWRDPFPRAALMKAIATFAAMQTPP
eukprot:TRINITY_DN18887_c0_g1_i1.p1 TRINITY_DN18887_c0_g1~~TRINITY_DN18887_c0_g1_i1.p1  ORF type:complete len:562 (-),score=132.18 TRINITY_DN18887_c0_g1_i1:46-1530(-)